MAILYDARGNEILIGFPDAVNGNAVVETRTLSNTLGALNAEVVIDLNAASTATFDIRTAAGALTLVFEVSVDGVNYFSVPAFARQQLLVAAIVQEQYVPSIVIATTQSGLYTVGVTGFRRVRARVSAYTSGNVTVSGRVSQSDLIIRNSHIPSNLHITATAGANAAATATLPTAGVGMFHYITNITLMRNATAALAGTATLIHTSTNLPGTPAWSVGNAMAAGGTQTDLSYSPTTPLKSLVANTATTIVMAAGGAAVLNRVNVSYYVGA